MTGDWTLVLELSTFVGTIVLLASGLFLWLDLRHRGGMDLALAHVVADPARRRGFIVALSTSLLGFLGFGVIQGLEDVFPGSTPTADLVGAILFAIGAIAIFYLIAKALSPSPLTLHEEWVLRESAERISMTPEPGIPGATNDPPLLGPY